MIYASAAYALAMVLANLAVAKFGPVVTPIVAFVLIGFDLAMRDWLQIRMKAWQMGALILATGLLTLVIQPTADRIAVASCVSFIAAALADWSVFVRLPGSWLRRSNGSNIAGAAVDSLLFPTLAFGALLPHIVLAQFAAKVAGGAVWSYILARKMA